jgi:chromosome segregation ATPase
MIQDREKTEREYINLKESNNNQLLKINGLSEHVSKMREEIFNLRRAIEEQALTKETREAEIRSYERKAKRGRKQSNQITGTTPPPERRVKKSESFITIDTADDLGFNIPDDESS